MATTEDRLPFLGKLIIKNIQRAMLEKYQVAHAFYRQEFKEKYISTCLSKYGVMNAGGAPTVQEKIHCHYFYDNKSFDSAPEIAYYIWLSDNAVKFEFQPADFFEYVHDGKAFKYWELYT